MKKVIALILTVVMAVACFAACGKEESKEKVLAKVLEVNLSDEEYAFGVDKNQEDLLQQVNEIIDQMMADGTYDEICNHYFGDGTPVAVKSGELDTGKKQLVVATNAAFEPFEYKIGNDYCGIDMEIAAVIAEKTGRELVIQNMDFEAVCLSVGQHKCDIAMAGLTVKADREEFVTFSKSYYVASQKLIVRSDDKKFSDCKSVEDVEKVLNSFDSKTKIGVQNGTTGKLYCEGDEEMGFPGLKVTVKGYKNGSLAVQDLLNGNIDYVIIDSAPAKCITEAINKTR